MGLMHRSLAWGCSVQRSLWRLFMAHGVCLYVCHICETYAHSQPHCSELKCGSIAQFQVIILVSDNWPTLSWRNSFVTAHATTLLDVVMLVRALHWTAACHLLLTEQPKTACFLFLSPLSVMCAVAQPVIELWKLAIFVFLWWCEMWSEQCECMDTSGGGSQSVAWE